MRAGFIFPQHASRSPSRSFLDDWQVRLRRCKCDQNSRPKGNPTRRTRAVISGEKKTSDEAIDRIFRGAGEKSAFREASEKARSGGRLLIQWIDPDKLIPNPRNPRKHSRQQIRALAGSMRRLGNNNPILVDEKLGIVAGHARAEASKLAGYKTVPVIVLGNLTPSELQAYMIADNQFNERSTWDDHILAVHLKELSDLAADLDIDVLGFEAPDVDFRIQGLEDSEEADRADEFKPASGPATTRVGDLWRLGESRILCGDALDLELISRLMDGEKASCGFADPPYNVRISGHVSGLGKIQHREFPMAAGEMNTAEFSAFLAQALKQIFAHSKPGAVQYVCMDWRHIVEVWNASVAAGFQVLNTCVWVKPNGGMGSFYRSRHEFVLVLRAGAPPHINNVQLGKFGRNRSNVWNYHGANGFTPRGRKRDLEWHPTVKPIAMVADAILDASRPKDIVLDIFLGSGTTLLACERTGRRCRGVELDPLYVDTAIERWQRLSDKAAIHADGRTFAQVAEERRTAGAVPNSDGCGAPDFKRQAPR